MTTPEEEHQARTNNAKEAFARALGATPEEFDGIQVEWPDLTQRTNSD